MSPTTSVDLDASSAQCHGDVARILLRLVAVDLPAADTVPVRFLHGEQRFRRAATVTPSADGVSLELEVPAARLAGRAWSLAYRPSPDAPFVDVDVHLEAGADARVALVAGPPASAPPAHSGGRTDSKRATGLSKAGRLAARVRREVEDRRPLAASIPPVVKRSAGGRADRRRTSMFAGFESFVPPGKGRRVVLLAHSSLRQEVPQWLEEFSGDRVSVISFDEAPEWGLEEGAATRAVARDLVKLLGQVRMLGAVDVIVDLLPPDLLPPGAKDRLQLFGSLFRYVDKGGVYVLDRRADRSESALNDLTTWLKVLTASENTKTLGMLDRHEKEIARSVGQVAVGRDLIIATKRLRHYVILRDAQVDRVLPAREPSIRLRELERRPGGEFTAVADVISHSPGFEETLPTHIEYPQLHLRHYEGRVALAGQMLMYTGSTILPDSFRWHLARTPTNPRLYAVSRHFARIDSAHMPRRELDGHYYQLDCAYPHHFGHVMSEVVSRLWGWDSAKRENPDLKAIFHLKPQSRKTPSLEKALFTAYGIDESDIEWVNEPVWLRSVVSATPMWQNEVPHYVHPDIVETWDRIGDGLLAGAQDFETYDRIFVSRGPGAKHRHCRNNEAVEQFFTDRGFRVVYPERLSMAQQVAVFRGARVIAGYGGSAMFNLMYARKTETVILLNQEAYIARNEHLYTCLTGGRVHYFWSQPDRPLFQSDWEFDFDRNGDELRRVLDEL